jgi:hypothetical protein
LCKRLKVAEAVWKRLAHRALRRLSNPAELPVIAPNVCHLMFDNQMMLRSHGDLNVVVDRSGSFATTGHRTGIWVGNCAAQFEDERDRYDMEVERYGS